MYFLYLIDDVITESDFNNFENKDLLDYLLYYYRYFQKEPCNVVTLVPFFEEVAKRADEIPTTLKLLDTIMEDNEISECVNDFRGFLYYHYSDSKSAETNILDFPYIFWTFIFYLEKYGYDFHKIDGIYRQLTLPFPEVAHTGSRF